jgi:PKD repeat protein
MSVNSSNTGITINHLFVLLLLGGSLLVGPACALPNLAVTAVTFNSGVGDELFANEPNIIAATIKNTGNDAALPFDVNLVTGSYSETKRRTTNLAAGSQTTLTFTGYAPSTTGEVTLTVTADSSSEVTESNEGDNFLQTTRTVYYNGYKGKRWTGGPDMNTQAGPFEGHINVVYSTGNSAYNGAGWTGKTYSWTPSDLPIPSDATITSARLYQGYTWDMTPGGSPLWTMTFDGVTVTPIATYSDKKGYGTYDYPQGLFVYDVTTQFNMAGNSMTITPQTGNNNGIYGAYLVVVYTGNAGEGLKKIWINDECDILYSGTSRSVSSSEATAYANFVGVSTENLVSAKAIAILQSANENGKSKFFFNSNEYTGFSPAYSGTTQIGFSIYDVTSALADGNNEVRIQSYDSGASGDNMYATNVILVVEEEENVPAPVADFSATPLSGNAPMTVTFTDSSTNTPTSWAWTIEGTAGMDYEYVDSTSAISQSPKVQFLKAGTYDVSLTATNDGGSDTESKPDYITVAEASVPAIEVTVVGPDVPLGTMIPPQAIGSTTVNIVASGGTSWSITASDKRTTAHNGFMTTAADLNLENPFELGKDGVNYQTLTSEPVTFWSDTAMGSFSATANMKQPVATGDQPGDYSITITFTGSIS